MILPGVSTAVQSQALSWQRSELSNVRASRVETGQLTISISKMRESCLQEFDAHWQCLEKNNQYFQACRKPEKALNDCVFSKLVRLGSTLE